MFWYPTNLKRQWNNRLNFNFQHQFPGQIVGSATWFMNFGDQHYTRAMNEVNPEIRVAQQNALNQPVDNPFFNYLTPQLFPGQLRNQRQVSLGSLLRPYPHYGPLYQIGTLGAGERYPVARTQGAKDVQPGLQLSVRLRVHQEKLQINTFNDMDYFSGTLRWQDSNQRHRITAAGTWDLPFSKAAVYGRCTQDRGCRARRLEACWRLDLFSRSARSLRQLDREHESVYR